MTFQLTPADSLYGEGLRNIPDQPTRLWGEGDPAVIAADLKVAIVGARRCTTYGRRIAFELGQRLARAGVVVVSGLAYGIDAEAHKGALAGGGKTIAVLGCGIDITYPAAHTELRRKIEASGAVITEFPKGHEAAPWTFPQRNRIISGLSKGVVVVEAAMNSGSLITARWAADQGREVFAVPGPVDSTVSAGTNRLIQQGAKLVSRVEDILEEIIPGFVVRESPAEAVSPVQGQILEMLSEPSSIDRLCANVGLAADKTAALMVELEIAGRVRALPGGLYKRT